MSKSKQSIQIIDDENISITLSTGTTFVMRNPRAIDANGLSQEAIRARLTEHVQKLVSRITTPVLSRITYSQLDLSDIQVINTGLDFFSATGLAKMEILDHLEELGLLSVAESTPTTSPE